MALTFQVVCWSAADEPVSDEQRKHTVRMFGKTAEGQSVCLSTTYFPHFYVELPAGAPPSQAATVVNDLSRAMPKALRADLLVDSCGMVMKKKLLGFTAGRQLPFVRLVFSSAQAARAADKMLGRIMPRAQTYQSNVDSQLSLMHARDLRATGWVTVPCGKWGNVADRKTACTIEAQAHWTQLQPAHQHEGAAPLVIASFDIETYSPDGSFPDGDRPQCPIITIATCFQRLGEAEPFKRTVLCLGETAPVAGAEMRWFDSEPALIEAWGRLLRAEDADVLIGYNQWGFDSAYVYKRCMVHCGDPAIDAFLASTGKLLAHTATLKEATLSSGAYGDNAWLILEHPGILQVDLLTWIKKEYKLESYSLNNVSKHFLGDAKVDLPIKEMMEAYRSGGAAGRAKIAEYCVKDTLLPLALASKLATLPQLLAMASATHVPAEWLLPRGQQVKVFSQIVRMARLKGFLVPAIRRQPQQPGAPQQQEEESKYVGATVLDAKTGAYMHDIIVCLDFAALYPSIMRAHTLCHSTIVLDPAYDNLPSYRYKEVDIPGMGAVRFAQTDDTVLPALLEELAAFRKEARRKQAAAKAAGDHFAASIFNGQQLAYKVSMNSVYGFCGANHGFLPCKPIAAAVTTIGRDMIMHTKAMVEKQYGAEVVYGDTDSVFLKFPGQPTMAEAFRLGEQAAAAVSATFKKPIELEFEKAISPYVLYSKKRYAGMMYEHPEQPPRLLVKGLQVVRRDSCPLVRETCRACLDAIMHNRDAQGAIEIARAAARRLLEGDVSVQELQMSKSLRSSYANEALQSILIPHPAAQRWRRSLLPRSLQSILIPHPAAQRWRRSLLSQSLQSRLIPHPAAQ